MSDDIPEVAGIDREGIYSFIIADISPSEKEQLILRAAPYWGGGEEAHSGACNSLLLRVWDSRPGDSFDFPLQFARGAAWLIYQDSKIIVCGRDPGYYRSYRDETLAILRRAFPNCQVNVDEGVSLPEIIP